MQIGIASGSRRNGTLSEPSGVLLPLPLLQRYEQRDPGFGPDFPRVVTLSSQILCYQYVAEAENALRPVPYFDLHRPTQVENASSAGRVVPSVRALGVKSPEYDAAFLVNQRPSVQRPRPPLYSPSLFLKVRLDFLEKGTYRRPQCRSV